MHQGCIIICGSAQYWHVLTPMQLRRGKKTRCTSLIADTPKKKDHPWQRLETGKGVTNANNGIIGTHSHILPFFTTKNESKVCSKLFEDRYAPHPRHPYNPQANHLQLSHEIIAGRLEGCTVKTENRIQILSDAFASCMLRKPQLQLQSTL